MHVLIGCLHYSQCIQEGFNIGLLLSLISLLTLLLFVRRIVTQFFTAGVSILNVWDAMSEVLAKVAETRNIEYPGKVDGMKMILLLQIFERRTNGQNVLAAKNQICALLHSLSVWRPPSCHVVHLLPTQVKVLCPGYCSHLSSSDSP